MKLRTLEETFLQGKIDKPSYITQMYQMHDKLFEYADFITDRDISEITITPNCVVFTTNNTSNGGGGG
ncbi:hypothetical protein Hc94105_1303 [Helicobacter cinaedi]|uniref:hypothetical protein n=1 Tax=Helicobacter cinaedi TaxID=213 RepID=UPI001F1D47C9|nr:hypothetical protein [Helicobacter cinaedi]BDB67092.1 hypothetical protein Hc94105_1303 [Helicobacter cinaedi]